MKKSLFLALALCIYGQAAYADNCCVSSCDESASLSCDPCDCRVSGKSFYSSRPHFSGSMPEKITHFHDRTDVKSEGVGGAIQAVVFGGKTTKCNRFATYFLPCCKSTWKVREDIDEAGANENYLAATHFGIVTTDRDFASEISLSPKQTVIGVGFEYEQNFWENDEGKKEYWFEIATSVQRIKNNIGFSETITSTGSGADTVNYNTDGNRAVGSMREAFSQSSWCCGKILCNNDSDCQTACDTDCGDTTDGNDACDTACISKTRLADIQFKIGHHWVQQEHCYFNSYAGVSAPTGNKVEGTYLFEPVVGHNNHVGLMFGSNAGFSLWESDSETQALWVRMNFDSLYLFERTEKRLIDVKGKPWSRYMSVFRNQAEAQAESEAEPGNIPLGAPGVEIFCRDVCVKPGLQRSFNTIFTFNCNRAMLEAGYNFSCRSAECVKLACAWETGPAFKDILGIITGSVGNAGGTDPVQQIFNIYKGNNIVSLADYDTALITEDQLDLNAAAHPCITTHTFYGSLGYAWDEEDHEYPLFIGAGGSYELSKDNTAANRWTAWGKIGFSF